MCVCVPVCAYGYSRLNGPPQPCVVEVNGADDVQDSLSLSSVTSVSSMLLSSPGGGRDDDTRNRKCL